MPIKTSSQDGETIQGIVVRCADSHCGIYDQVIDKTICISFSIDEFLAEQTLVRAKYRNGEIRYFNVNHVVCFITKKGKERE